MNFVLWLCDRVKPKRFMAFEIHLDRKMGIREILSLWGHVTEGVPCDENFVTTKTSQSTPQDSSRIWPWHELLHVWELYLKVWTTNQAL